MVLRSLRRGWRGDPSPSQGGVCQQEEARQNHEEHEDHKGPRERRRSQLRLRGRMMAEPGVHMMVSRAVHQKLHALRKRTGKRSLASTLRHALEVFDFLQALEARGTTFIIHDSTTACSREFRLGERDPDAAPAELFK